MEEFRSDTPPELTGVLDRMMAKDPNERYQNPAEVMDALAKFIDERIDVRLDERLREIGGGVPPVAPPPAAAPADSGASRAAREPLQAPAVGLKWVAVVNMICAGFSLVALVQTFPVAGRMSAFEWQMFLVPAVTGLLAFPAGFIILYGSEQMRTAGSYRWAKAAAWLMFLPFPLFPWPLTVAFGMWALRVLRRAGRAGGVS